MNLISLFEAYVVVKQREDIARHTANYVWFGRYTQLKHKLHERLVNELSSLDVHCQKLECERDSFLGAYLEIYAEKMWARHHADIGYCSQRFGSTDGN